jgi:hypothetical protein
LRTVLDFLRKGDVLMVKRAERRLGELMEVARKAGKLAKPPLVKGAGRGKKGKTSGFRKTRGLSLKDQDIDKQLADRARKAAALPEDKFEAEVARAVDGLAPGVVDLCRCSPRHPRAAALQRPCGQARH